jgi:hypothetical protein
MIDASQRMIKEQNNPIINEHFELEIKTLQNAPRDPTKLERIIKAKERQKDDEDASLHIQEMQTLVTEIEMLKFVLCLVNRRSARTYS